MTHFSFLSNTSPLYMDNEYLSQDELTQRFSSFYDDCETLSTLIPE